MKAIVKRLAEFIHRTSSSLPADAEAALKQARRREAAGSSARMVLDTILRNVALAREAGTPVCQDTGTLTFFIDESLRRKVSPEVLNEAVAYASEQGWLRRNTVDSLSGKSIDSNVCPGSPVVHYVSGLRVSNPRTLGREGARPSQFAEMPNLGGTRSVASTSAGIRLIMKGGGSENMSVQFSLPDAELGAGRDFEGVRRCVLAAVQRAQGFGCAPGFLGVCVGGDRASGFEEAKLQLLRRMDDVNPEARLAKLERRILREANSLGIGPMGLGGATTLLGVKIGTRPRLPASYFVTVAYMCWAARRGEMVV